MENTRLFMTIKDGIINEQNLTAHEARLYRGTDIKVVPQRGRMEPFEMNLVTAVPFRARRRAA